MDSHTHIIQRYLVVGLRSLSALSAAASLFFFLIFPMRSFQQFFGANAMALDKYRAGIIALGIIGTVFFVLIERLFTETPHLTEDQELSAPPVGTSLGYKVIFMALGCLIFYNAISGLIYAPLDWDELDHASGISEGAYWKVLNPGNTQNHTLSTGASVITTKIFGMNKWGVRIPALIFTGLLILALVLFGPASIGSLPTAAIMAHLAVNQMFTWHAHSMRGYIAMLAVTSTILILVVQTLSNPIIHKERKHGLLALILVAPFTHTFGGVFGLLMLLSLVAWYSTHRKNLTIHQLQATRSIALALIASIPVIAVLSLFRLGRLQETGFIFAPVSDPQSFTYIINRLIMGFGMAAHWEAKILLILAVSLMTYRALFVKGFDFLCWFVLLSVMFFASSFILLELPVLEGRMILATVPALVAWMVQSVFLIEARPTRLAAATLGLVALFMFPLRHHKTLLQADLTHFQEHENFVEQVRSQQQFANTCLDFVGDPEGSRYISRYYFHDQKQLPCKPSYLFYISKDLFDQQYDLPTTAAQNMSKKLFDDDQGRMLFELSVAP